MSAWEEWLATEEGQAAVYHQNLDVPAAKAKYLANRLHNAFEAGMRAGENLTAKGGVSPLRISMELTEWKLLLELIDKAIEPPIRWKDSPEAAAADASMERHIVLQQAREMVGRLVRLAERAGVALPKPI